MKLEVARKGLTDDAWWPSVAVHGDPVRIASPCQTPYAFGVGCLTGNRKEGVLLEQPVHRNITVTVWKKPAKALGFVPAAEERKAAQDPVDRLGIRDRVPAAVTTGGDAGCSAWHREPPPPGAAGKVPASGRSTRSPRGPGATA
ncbi:hypothetical protein [Streptomyces argyrophylli]|uniref:hypothetical protein n=1 Tax=Streptomyces argyrophylli TaxID=2726118 RepID=UPI002017FC7F|nr:hypothetical protein [Streptomyces argyrophyllae]